MEKNNTPKPVPKKYPYVYTGTELLNMVPNKIPYLWNPFINKQGLIALTGSSDVGKSSFLRQFAIAIAMKEKDFLGHKLEVKHGRVIYYTTEDSQVSINILLKKQLPTVDPKLLTGLCYIFNTENPLRIIEDQLKEASTDVVIIDCFADIFDGQMNDISSIRRFLNKYDKLSLEYDCVFVFLHHNGKRTELVNPSKNHIIGSQGFEAKMRLVMELRKNGDNSNRSLWFTKGNYLPESQKKVALELKFDDKQEFTFIGTKATVNLGLNNSRKFNDADKSKIMLEVKKHLNKKLSLDKVIDELKKVGFNAIPSKGTLHTWIKESKSVQSTKSTK